MNTIARIIKNRLLLLGKSLKSSAGFSFIEIMIVVVIIGILTALIAPKIMDFPNKAKVSAAKQQIENLKLALSMYNNDNGTYPSTEQGLLALVQKPNNEPLPTNYNEKGYLDKKQVPKDPWGRDYVYKSPGDHGNDFEIMSYGADGKDGGEGYNTDIKSWE
jgi:general secretion pathway protein G